MSNLTYILLIIAIIFIFLNLSRFIKKDKDIDMNKNRDMNKDKDMDKDIIYSTGRILDQNNIKNIQNSIDNFNNLKIKEGQYTVSKSGIKMPDLENFYDYAPPDIVQFSFDKYLDTNGIDKSDANNKKPHKHKVYFKETVSELIQPDNKFHPVDLSSEMTTAWYDKISKDALIHNFKLMDNVPRVQVPLVTISNNN